MNDHAVCIWCEHASQAWGISNPCGIRCGENWFLEDGKCEKYKPVDGAARAVGLVEEDFLSSANDAKWALREAGGEWNLLAAAVIDALQDELENAGLDE